MQQPDSGREVPDGAITDRPSEAGTGADTPFLPDGRGTEASPAGSGADLVTDSVSTPVIDRPGAGSDDTHDPAPGDVPAAQQREEPSGDDRTVSELQDRRGASERDDRRRPGGDDHGGGRRDDRQDGRDAYRGGRDDRGGARDGHRGGREDRRGGRDERRGGRDDRRDRAGRPDRGADTVDRPHIDGPELPDSISASDLDGDVRRDLRGLQKETAETVARHLVAAGVLVDDDPELALEHARYARRRASRIAVVREAAGIVAYHAGEWNEALGEFRAARRMGGGPGHVHVMADIERALGRPERAIDLARSPEARDLGAEERIELLIVAAGARRDLGEFGAAVVGLQVSELDAARRDPWSARLFYAYADNLLAAGRESEAVQWFVHAHDADTDGLTDAGARIAELTGDELPGTADDDLSIGYEDVPADQVAYPDRDRTADGAARPAPDEEPVSGTGGPLGTLDPEDATEDTTDDAPTVPTVDDAPADAGGDAAGEPPAPADRPDAEQLHTGQGPDTPGTARTTDPDAGPSGTDPGDSPDGSGGADRA
ncbi:tetratricopeptide repeat protein [Pseudonocardia sp. HH130630-07]|uniref:tetratricopeptide repeat protein n=1 Tax=Pseudonocardia sp. HH130630-07 TaxID=1690815 RepID=UPI0012EAEAA4|nr:hypothetical protein [Pseudonocardia sp. HH130630-07]